MSSIVSTLLLFVKAFCLVAVISIPIEIFTACTAGETGIEFKMMDLNVTDISTNKFLHFITQSQMKTCTVTAMSEFLEIATLVAWVASMMHSDFTTYIMQHHRDITGHRMVLMWTINLIVLVVIFSNLTLKHIINTVIVDYDKDLVVKTKIIVEFQNYLATVAVFFAILISILEIVGKLAQRARETEYESDDDETDCESVVENPIEQNNYDKSVRLLRTISV